MVPTDQEKKWVRSNCIHRYFCINFLKVVDRTQIQYLFIINPQTAGRLDNYRTYILNQILRVCFEVLRFSLLTQISLAAAALCKIGGIDRVHAHYFDINRIKNVK